LVTGFFLQIILATAISEVQAAQSPVSTDRNVAVFNESGHRINNASSGGDATGMATGMASSAASNTLNQWFRQFGTAKVDLRTDTHFTLKGSSLDLLVPLSDSPEDVFFTQGGVRYNDKRVTTNLGLGHRHFTDSWMLGYNAFYDATWNNVNRRWGLGLETWRDNLRLSSNFYHGISGWHNSHQHEKYDERPADGWDVRLDGWLPAIPQIGIKLIYEQYYGKNVALFNNFSNRQKNPHAVTLGLNYTPVPLVTLGAEQKMGKGGINDTQFMANLNYRIGKSWNEQLAPASVKTLRDISNSRLELVNRNNEIVLDYRKQNELQLSLPTRLTGEESAIVTLIPSVKSSNGLDHIEIDDSALLQAGGQLLSVANTAIRIRMPVYQPQPVRLTGVAVDRKGNRSNVAETLLITTPKEAVLSLTPNKREASADGNDSIIVTLHLADHSGVALAKQAVSWRSSGGLLSAISKETDSNGNATVNLTSDMAGSFTVTAIAANKTATTGTLRFTPTVRPQVIVDVDKAIVLANKTDAATYTVTVKDANDQPVAGQSVKWATNLGTLASSSGITDTNGQLKVKLTSAAVGQATVTASTAGQTVNAPVVTFIAETPVATINVDKTNLTANGIDTATYTVTVKNKKGEVIAGQLVNWATNFGTLSSSSGTTDTRGQLQVKLTSTVPGQAIVSAEIAGQIVTASPVTFNVNTFGKPEISTQFAESTGRINKTIADITKYYATYRNIQVGDAVEMSFSINFYPEKNFTKTHTVTAAEVAAGKAIFGPYGGELSGITKSSLLTISAKVTRPSTGETKESDSRDYIIDTEV